MTATAMSNDPLGDGAPAAALDLLDVDQRAPTEVLGPEADDVDVAEPGRQGDVVAGVGELAGEPVDDLRLDRRQRDQHAGGAGRLEHLLGRLDPAEHVAPPRTPMSSGPTNPTTR